MRKRVLPGFVWVVFLQFRQLAGQDFEPEVLLVAEAVSPFLDGADLVVEAFDEAQGHLVAGLAVADDPVAVDRRVAHQQARRRTVRRVASGTKMLSWRVRATGGSRINGC